MDRYQAMTTFLRVVESGSFSGAARLMNVGQPAISKTVALLEDRLRVSLLLRSTHGLTPTEAGLRFYERARRAIEEADEAELEARGAGSGLSGCLRVSAGPTFASLHVLPHLPEFLAEHPDLEVEVILDDRRIDLISEGIDIALRGGTLADSNALARKLATSPRSIFAAPAYLEKMGMPRSPAELADHNVVVYTQAPNAWVLRKESTEAAVVIHGRVRVSAAEGLRAAVLAGIGLTIAPNWMFVTEMKAGTVRTVLDAWSLPTIDLWGVFPTGRLVSTKAREFANFVERVVAKSLIAADRL